MLLLCLSFGTVLLAAAPCRAGMLFVIVSKSLSDRNFIRVYEAALAEAVKNGDRMILIGGEGQAHFRKQDQEVSAILRRHPDGLAISVLRSDHLAENSIGAARDMGIPVIAFDSDFTPKYHYLRAGYIGTDNVELGRELGRQAKVHRQVGGTVAILTGGLDETNLEDRIQGVVQELGLGREGSPWRLARSPIPCRDDYDQSLKQLETLLDDPAVDVIISVGWWAQMARGYESLVRRYQRTLSNKSKILIFAGAAPRQVELFQKRLSHVNIGLDFEAMGRLAYQYLRTLAGGRTIPPVTHTPMRIFSQDCQYIPGR